MIIFCNNKNEIKDVGVNSMSDPSLTEFEIDDTDNPFKTWSNAKICCYKCTVIGGKVTMMTPYLDSRLIEHIEQLGKQGDTNSSDIADNSEGIYDLAEVVSDDSESIYDLADIISELDERVSALEEK